MSITINNLLHMSIYLHVMEYSVIKNSETMDEKEDTQQITQLPNASKEIREGTSYDSLYPTFQNNG